MKQIKNVHVFTAGPTVDSAGQEFNYSIEDLKEIASTYDTTVHEGPIVWGHNADKGWYRHLRKATQLANGWIKSLRVEGEKLLADIEVDSNTYSAIKNNQLKKRSMAFYQPNAKHNPSPGKWYVRHLALLGSDPPAIKGLADISIFSEEVYNQETFNTNNTNSMTKEEAKLALDENASDWLAAAINDEGNGFNEEIVSFDPTPAEENNWLWNEENEEYSGKLTIQAGDEFEFSIKKDGDSWTSVVKPILGDEEAQAEESSDFSDTEDSEETPQGEDESESELEELRRFKAQAEEQMAMMKKYMEEAEAAKKEKAYSEVSQFCDQMYDDGRMLESTLSKKSLISLLISLLEQESATYSDGDSQVSVFDGVKAILNAFPKSVEFSESIASRTVNTPVVKVPKSYGNVSKQGAEEYSNIRIYMEQNGISDFREGRRQYLNSCSK